MAIKIVKVGIKPEEKVYQGKCNHCNTVVTASPSDGKTTSDQRDGNFFSFPCPHCGRQMHVDIHSRNEVTQG